MITAEQLKDVLDRTEALKRYLNIDSKLIQVEEEQLRTQAPGFWDDPKKAEVQMKKVKDLQSWIDGYRQVKALADELQLAMDFYKEELVTEQEVDDNYAKALDAVESLELKNMLREEADEMDCVLKINSGAGGTESQDWAQMLMRMYMRWGEDNKYKVTVANLQEGDELILQEWQGDKSYGMIMPENNSNPDFVFRYRQNEFAVECKWRERLTSDWAKDLFPTRRIENYKHFSEVRHMPVTIILGVGGEPCNPELLYKIPLEEIASITSGDQSIVDYLHPLLSFNISMFLQQEQKSKEKAYTLDEKRKQFPNAYKPWSTEDDKLLITLHYENRSIKELMSIFKRNEGAIHSRIQKLVGKSNGEK